jgi:MFS superfamily sulfate permease-like transporter
MRYLAVFFLFISFALHAYPQATVNASVQAERSGKHENETSSSTQQRQSELGQTSKDASQAPEKRPEDEQQNDQRKSDERAYRVNIVSQPTGGWTIAYVFITAFLGLIGAVTLGVLIYQTLTLRRQVRLQERGQRQWVDTKNWRSGTPYFPRPQMLEIAFDIVNPTTAPIALMLVRITVSGGQVTATGFPKNTLLIPDTPLTYRAYLNMNRQQRESYRSETGLILQVEGSVTYIDSLKDRWEQRFLLILGCHHGLVQANAGDYTHTLHEVKLDYDPDAPRTIWRRMLDWYLAQIEAMKNGDSECE